MCVYLYVCQPGDGGVYVVKFSFSQLFVGFKADYRLSIKIINNVFSFSFVSFCLVNYIHEPLTITDWEENVDLGTRCLHILM